MELTNKIAIVTGSSKGIGLETCKALLKEGVKVAGWSRSGTDIDHPDFENITVDVGHFENVKEGYRKTVNRFGEDIQILVNNAGLGFEGDFDTMSVEDWKLMFSTNVDGIFFCSKLAIPAMKRLDEGHIFNIASIAGTTGISGMAGYCGTKFAVRGISQSMFKELREFGIKVTCINPGSTATNFFDEIDSVTVNENMMRPEDIAGSIIDLLKSSENYHPVELEVRPLRPKGRK